jgi:hypothetical protein
MSEQQLILKSVFELLHDGTKEQLPFRYRIPAYQRGYRWTGLQVTQLLEDIREFTLRKNPQPEEFYCLQPLVLKVLDDKSYEVVDGQQRLTTILLILRYFNSNLKKPMITYKLEYETRPKLLDFLELPPAELTKAAATNIDYFQISEALKTIEEWFKLRENETDRIKDHILNNAKVIWFELSASESSVEAFTRLNVGKIPLTSSELIRALFLRRGKDDNLKSLQMRIAYEWDLLEKALQENDFWYFLKNDDLEGQSNRIGFLFDLDFYAEGMGSSADTYATFYHYSKKLNEKNADPEREWRAIKQRFMMFEEWFKDRRLYHLVGFLIWAGVDLNELHSIAIGKTKQAFRAEVKARIFNMTVTVDHNLAAISRDVIEAKLTDLENLNYRNDKDKIKKILLLFNLATLLLNQASNIRFQFDSFKNATWDIEHVRSVAIEDDQLIPLNSRIELLKAHLEYPHNANEDEYPELRNETIKYIELKKKEDTETWCNELYNRWLRVFRETDSGDADHSLSNLVLLDCSTNRSYKNAVFFIKRLKVLLLDGKGVFVPLCTRNVFLKSYNPSVKDLMFWTQEDRDCYKVAILEMLKDFFCGGWIDE